MKSILVVCEGNICRSPMAEGLLKRALPAIEVYSAGLGALVGYEADETAVRILVERGVNISSHRATQITRDMCLRADLVLVMDKSQKQRLESNYPQACGRIFRLGEFIGRDIPDPYCMPEKAFRDALSLIEASLREWLPRIRKISQGIS